MGDPELNKKHFGRKEPRGEPTKNTNPNARVKEIKARFGMAYNYRFLEIDNLQREFYFEMVRREKEERGKAWTIEFVRSAAKSLKLWAQIVSIAHFCVRKWAAKGIWRPGAIEIKAISQYTWESTGRRRPRKHNFIIWATPTIQTINSTVNSLKTFASTVTSFKRDLGAQGAGSEKK